MEREKKPTYKYCIVPYCKNSIRNSPKKVFFLVPRGVDIRRQWCKIIKRDMMSPSTCLYCCEDHFDIEEDTANYMEYKIMNLQGNHKTVLRLKKGVLPHKFHGALITESQPQSEQTSKRIKRLHIKEEALSVSPTVEIELSQIDQKHPEDVPHEPNTLGHIPSPMPLLSRIISSSPAYGEEEEVENSDHKPFSDQSSDEDSTSLDLANDLWGLFDEWPHGRAQCTMCKTVVKKKPQVLYNHLMETHAGVFEHLQSMSNENYTETICIEDPISGSEPAWKRPNFKTQSYKEPLKVTTSLRRAEYEETEHFGRYVAALLRDIPKQACVILQMDIVKLIMDAKLNTPIHNTIEDQGNVEQVGVKDKQDNQLEEIELETCECEKIDIQTEPHILKLPKKRPKSTKNMTNDSPRDDAIEMESFEKYVTSLLKTVSNKETETKLQMDIINLIMTARLKDLSKSAPNIITSIDNVRDL